MKAWRRRADEGGQVEKVEMKDKLSAQVKLTPRTSSKHSSMSIVLNTHSRKRREERYVNLVVPMSSFLSLELISHNLYCQA